MRIVSKPRSDAAPARMAPLSVLPLFLDIKGKRALVAGGSDAAAWKAELLAAAGAEVHVHAPAAELSDEFARLLAATRTQLTHHDKGWSDEALAGMAIAIADAEDPTEAAAFAAAAQRAGIPCNVIDRPEFCTFQLGSIVNRSPVVIGISSSGAAPILAQAIRQRIETLLPHSLASWASLAQRLRGWVTERLKPGGQRRAFWEAFVDRAFGAAPRDGDETRLRELVLRIAASPAGDGGRVTLVGAGPGQPELLTLQAVRVLQGADVILFERRVSAEVLELARREAKRIPIDDRRDRAEAIEDMASLARAGKRVVLLQVGDAAPAARDAARLRGQGIRVEIVRGLAARPGSPRSAARPGHRGQTAELPSAMSGEVRHHAGAGG